MINTLRKLILTYVFLLVLFMLTAVFFEISTLESIESIDTFSSLDIFSVIYLVIFLITLFFLYRLKPFSKYLFLVFVFLDFPLYFLDPSLSHFDGFVLGDNLILILTYLEYMIIGMILSLLFFTDLKKQFK